MKPWEKILVYGCLLFSFLVMVFVVASNVYGLTAAVSINYAYKWMVSP